MRRFIALLCLVAVCALVAVVVLALRARRLRDAEDPSGKAHGLAGAGKSVQGNERGANRVGHPARVRAQIQAAIEQLRKADPLGSPEDLFTDDRYFTGPPLTEEMIRAAEAALGYKLPKAYLRLLRIRNGGCLKRACFPFPHLDDWPPDYHELSGIYGIGGKWGIDSKDFGSRHLISDWGYPDVGIVLGVTPSAGHDTFMLDYSVCGPKGEPRVIHVETETSGEPEVRVLAADLETFLRSLVNREEFLCAAARVKYGTAIELNPRDGEAYFNWGDALDEAGRYAEACEKFAKAAEIAPRDARVYKKWATALVDLRRYAEACQKCAKAVEIDPRDAMAYWWWGIALAHLGKLGKADEKWDKAIELDPALKANLEGMRERILGEK